MALPPPDECYSVMGFTAHDSLLPHLEASEWRRLMASYRLEDMRRRILVRRDQANLPLVDAGYVVGYVPALGLSAEESEKLLFTLTEGLARGFETLADWQTYTRL